MRLPTISATSSAPWRLPDAVEHWSLTTLRDRLIKIGGKIVRHGRYVTFQMTEVAVPRALFADHPAPRRPAQTNAGAGMIGGLPCLRRHP